MKTTKTFINKVVAMLNGSAQFRCDNVRIEELLTTTDGVESIIRFEDINNVTWSLSFESDSFQIGHLDYNGRYHYIGYSKLCSFKNDMSFAFDLAVRLHRWLSAELTEDGQYKF